MNYNSNKKRWLVCLSLAVILLAISQSGCAQAAPEQNKSRAITQVLREVVDADKAPGIIGAILSSEGIIAIGSAGVRKAGSDIPYTINDLVHLGSCAKAMTSAMLATLVEEGKLAWDMKFIEAIPELKEKIHSDYHNVTLWQLLTHTAGVPDWWTLSQRYTKGKRLELLRDKLKNPSPYKLGEFNYSNLGYVMAGCMAERITGKSWETLMKERLFKPLGMTSTGFGVPGKLGRIEQPWGHGKSGFGWRASQKDSSEAIGPAGTIHCSIEDWARFLSIFLSDKNPILGRKSLEKLVEPVGHYAGGWVVIEQPWAKGLVYVHGGSNSTWYSSVLVDPNMDRAFIVVTNSRDFGVTANLCCNEVMIKLIRMELQEKND